MKKSLLSLLSIVAIISTSTLATVSQVKKQNQISNIITMQVASLKSQLILIIKATDVYKNLLNNYSNLEWHAGNWKRAIWPIYGAWFYGNFETYHNRVSGAISEILALINQIDKSLLASLPRAKNFIPPRGSKINVYLAAKGHSQYFYQILQPKYQWIRNLVSYN